MDQSCPHTSTGTVVERYFTSPQSDPGFQSHWSPLLSHPSASESRQTERGKELTTDVYCTCDVWMTSDPSGEALIHLTVQHITHDHLFQLHLTDQHIPNKHFLLTRWPRKTPKSAGVIHALSDRLILPLGRSYVEQPPSAENPLWEQ